MILFVTETFKYLRLRSGKSLHYSSISRECIYACEMGETVRGNICTRYQGVFSFMISILSWSLLFNRKSI